MNTFFGCSTLFSSLYQLESTWRLGLKVSVSAGSVRVSPIPKDQTTTPEKMTPLLHLHTSYTLAIVSW